MRAFAPEDLPALKQLDAECFPPLIAYSRAELHYFIRHPRSTTTVAEHAGKVCGFCIVDWKLESGRKLGHFITIDVASELRRQGIGQMLMLAGETRLREAGCLAITLEVAKGNLGAQSFYQKSGYEMTGRIPGYYADGADALVMRKSLDTGE